MSPVSRILSNVPCAAACAATLISAWAATAVGADEPPVDAATLAIRAVRLQGQVRGLAGEEEILDTLHFAWSDRPYARATLAVAIKTTSVLAREAEMRRFGNGAIADATVVRMLDWVDKALDRAASAEPDPQPRFRPHRLRVALGRLRTTGRPRSVYAFIDGATSTRTHPAFGDLDLLAALGVRAYAVPLTPRSDRDGILDTASRTSALGMATALIRGPGDSAVDLPSLPDGAGIVTAVTLEELLTGAHRAREAGGAWVGVLDPAFGEPWPCSLARRALCRGVLGQSRYVAASWVPPVGRVPKARRGDAVAAAMWMHALDGQALGLVPGWRDLRDGSASLHASLFTDPATLERIASTNLDLLRLTDTVACFDKGSSLAIAVDDDAIDAKDGNAWSAWTEPVWAALASHAIPFDVVSIRAGGQARRYGAVVPIRRDGAGNADAFVARVERVLADAATDRTAIQVRGQDDGLPSDLFARCGRTKAGTPLVAVINLSNDERQVKVQGEFPGGAALDRLSGKRIGRPAESIDLAPWQVRVLEPLVR